MASITTNLWMRHRWDFVANACCGCGRGRKTTYASAVVGAVLVVSGCNDTQLNDFFSTAVPQPIKVTGTFGQLDGDMLTGTLDHFVTLEVNPSDLEIRSPSTGCVKFVSKIDGILNCIVLKPKARRTGTGTSTEGLDESLQYFKDLRVVIGNLDIMELRDDIIELEMSSAGESFTDAPTKADEFLDVPLTTKEEDWPYLDVYAEPEVSGSSKPWSMFGIASGSVLKITAYEWDDINDNDVDEDGERTFVNPLPYLSKIPGLEAKVVRQGPRIVELKMEQAPTGDFSSATEHFFNLATGAMTPDEVVTGKMRFSFQLEEHAAAAPDGPTVVPYAITYALNLVTRDSGGTITSRDTRQRGIIHLNEFIPSNGSTIRTLLYTPNSDSIANRYGMFVPANLAVGPAEVPKEKNGLDPTLNAAFDVTDDHEGSPLFPPGDYELVLSVWDVFDATSSSHTVTGFFSIMFAGLNIALDVDADGVAAEEGEAWDQYLPGYEGTAHKIDDTHTQNLKVLVEGVSPGNVVRFELEDTTSYEGFCTNAKATGFDDEDTDHDFILNTSDAGISDAMDANDAPGAVTKTATGSSVFCWLRCRDYGGETKLKVFIDGTLVRTILLPQNSDASASDHLPDAWESLFASPLDDLTDEDVDFEGLHVEKGDGLSAFEEYRGFRIIEPWDPTDATRRHRRTNDMVDHTPGGIDARNGGPLVKDGFIADFGIGGVDPPFQSFGNACDVLGFSWHRVHPEDKGDDPARYFDQSGRLNRFTPAAMKVQDHFALLIKGKDLEPGELGLAGRFADPPGPFFNDPQPAVFDLAQIAVNMARFGKTEATHPTEFAAAKSTTLAHEIGHRLTLRHLCETYLLDGNDVKPLGSTPEPDNKFFLVSSSPSRIVVRLKIQRRSDDGHMGQGYVTEFIDDEPVGVVFSNGGTAGVLWEAGPPGDHYVEQRAMQYEIPPANITVVTAGTPVEVADVVFSFKNDISSEISNVASGVEEARVTLTRGYTCLMDAKLVEQDPPFGLISVDRTTVDLRTRIQIKGPRTKESDEQ